MNKKDREKVRKLLEDDKKRLVRHLADLTQSSESEMNMGVGDSIDVASLEISQAGLQKIGKREKFLLKKIEHALAKDDDDFGVCEECGEEIGVKRLMARPVAQLCIDCKTEQESSERRFGSDEEDRDSDDVDDTAAD